MISFHYLEVSDSTGLAASLYRIGYLWFHSLVSELRGQQPFRLTCRRILILWILAIVLPALAIWNHLGFWLDDRLFPAWRETSVDKPVFLVGNARSGTTWLHRLLSECKGGLTVKSTTSTRSSQKSSKNSEPTTTQPETMKVDDHSNANFTTFRTWEILFAVSVTWKILFHGLYVIDQNLFKGLIFHLLLQLEHTYLGHIKIHPIGLMEAEEDEWLMMHVGLAQLLFFFFPAVSEAGNPLIFFDYHPDMLPVIKDMLAASTPSVPSSATKFNPNSFLKFDRRKLLPLSTRLMIMRYYRECVQRHLYFKQLSHSAQRKSTSTPSSGFSSPVVPSPPGTNKSEAASSLSPKPSNNGEKTWVFLSKNPAFTLRLESLYAVFPSAKVICLLRDPVQSVPSMVSYISCVWHAFNSPKHLYPEARRLLSFCEAHYLYPLMVLHEKLRHPSSFAFVSYHELTRALARIVTQDLLPRLFPVVNAAGQAERVTWKDLVDGSMVSYLKEEEKKSKTYASSHDYAFAACCEGLSVAELQQNLNIVYRVHSRYFPSQPMT